MCNQIDRESCVYFRWAEIWNYMDYVDDAAYCDKKNAYIDSPLPNSNDFFDYYITCPCKTHYKKHEEWE